MVDRWEEQIAKGEIPDLMEAFDEESIRHIKKLKAAAEARDPYQGMSMKDTVDRVERQARKEGLHVGDREAQRRQLQEKELLEKLSLGFGNKKVIDDEE